MAKATAAPVAETEVPEELPDTSVTTAVQELVDVGFYPMPDRLAESRRQRGLNTPDIFKVVFRPRSYSLDVNPEWRDEGPHDCNVDVHFVFTNDGPLMGRNSPFGKVKEAFQAVTEAAGNPIKLTKNSVFRDKLIGMLFETETGDDSYVRRNPERDDGQWVDEDGNPDEEAIKKATRHNYYSLPIAVIDEDEWTEPPENAKRNVRRGYRGAGGVVEQAVEVSEEQEEALKRAINGKAEEEYPDALFESEDSEILMVAPFMNEAAAGNTLTARAKALGGKVLGGRVYFAELEDDD